jgi:hypothetical protein
MRPHRRPSLFKLFCCQIVRSLNALHFRICDVSSESTSIESVAARYAGAGLQLSEFFQNTTRCPPTLWRSCVPLQFRDASAPLRTSASGKPLRADRHLLALCCASTSTPNLHCNVAAVSENFKRSPSIRVRRHPMQPAISSRTPRAGFVFASVARSRRCRARAAAGGPGIMMRWVGTSEVNDA